MRINERTLIGIGAVAAMAGGALRVVSSFIPYAPESPGLELLYAIEDALMLFGLMGVYFSVATETGWTGLAGFVVAVIGLASIVGPDPVMFGINFYEAGASCLLAGLSIFSAALMLAGQLRLAAGLWIAALILAVAGAATAQPVLIAASGGIFGLAFLASGFAVSNSSAGPAHVRR